MWKYSAYYVSCSFFFDYSDKPISTEKLHSFRKLPILGRGKVYPFLGVLLTVIDEEEIKSRFNTLPSEFIPV